LIEGELTPFPLSISDKIIISIIISIPSLSVNNLPVIPSVAHCHFPSVLSLFYIYFSLNTDMNSPQSKKKANVGSTSSPPRKAHHPVSPQIVSNEKSKLELEIENFILKETLAAALTDLNSFIDGNMSMQRIQLLKTKAEIFSSQLKSVYMSSSETISALECACRTLQMNLEEQEKECSKKTSESQELAGALQESLQLLSSERSKKLSYKSRLSEQDLHFHEMQKTNIELETKVNNLTNEISRLSDISEERLSIARANLTSFSLKCKALENAVVSQENELEQNTYHIGELEKALKSYEQVLQKERESSIALKQDIKLKELALGRVESTVEEKDIEISELRKKLHGLDNRFIRLESHLFQARNLLKENDKKYVELQQVYL
jgi:chromosome segregation ATPase